MGTSRVLINGTAKQIREGRVLINGTSYAIYSGKTLIGGTAKDIILVSFINAIPKMTSNTAGASPGGTCSDSASSADAWKCFDNSTSTYKRFSWTSTAGTAFTHWTQYVTPLGSVLEFNAVAVRITRPTTTRQTAYSWSVQISNNGTNWTTIQTGNTAVNTTYNLTQTYRAKYIRLVDTITYSASGSRTVDHYHIQTSKCSGCAASCTGCSGSCSGSCSGCTDYCTGCTDACTGSCGGNCTGTCSGGCEGRCQGCNGCQNNCTGCGDGCADACGSGCYSICGGSCATDCEGGCQFGCLGGCSGVRN